MTTGTMTIKTRFWYRAMFLYRTDLFNACKGALGERVRGGMLLLLLMLFLRSRG
jgi:hypothetical protein